MWWIRKYIWWTDSFYFVFFVCNGSSNVTWQYSWVNLVSLPLSEKDKYLLVYLKHITYPQLMCINNNIHFRQATRKIDTKSGRNLVGMSHMCEQNIFEGTSSSSKSELLLVSLHYINMMIKCLRLLSKSTLLVLKALLSCFPYITCTVHTSVHGDHTGLTWQHARLGGETGDSK